MSSIQLLSQSGRRGLRIVRGKPEREVEMVDCQAGRGEGRMLPERKRTGLGIVAEEGGGRGDGARIMVAKGG